MIKIRAFSRALLGLINWNVVASMKQSKKVHISISVFVSNSVDVKNKSMHLWYSREVYSIKQIIAISTLQFWVGNLVGRKRNKIYSQINANWNKKNISPKNRVLNDKHPRFWHLHFGWCDRRDPMASNLHITRNYRECRKETNVWRKN